MDKKINQIPCRTGLFVLQISSTLFQLWGGNYVHHVRLSSPRLFRFRRPCSWVWKIIYGTISLKCMNRPLNRIIRHDLGITIDTILTDLQIGVQTALKSGFVYVDGQTRRHSPFSFSIRGRSHQKSARVTQQESKGSSWFSSVQLIVRLSCWKNSVYTHFWFSVNKKRMKVVQNKNSFVVT